ncbi:hypothetical protein P170DRAFT_449306 [Aspergillus steynii IBT 23096]|uniref:Fork-head domain-containing protein n=1 Tax=Aspergillus steynii IBT 23096 TaxID=1392250 RepID=A0A2I2FYE3_9EURO|nr:uncharacterized protein P170DRAFT_449306 [Aspergillus steynii IBT 23096]PLB45650.1 hypothetical protein P170DRAFT_449306 [Aspergillus steynii IBT 23096]
MDRYVPSSNFQLETAGSSSVSDGALGETSRHSNPCSTIENWTSSNSRSPGSMISCQHPCAVGMPPSYSMGPSHPPMETVAEGGPRVFPYDQGWPSSLMAPSSTTAPLQPGLRRSHEYNGPPEWGRETDGSTFNPDPSSYASSRAHVSPQHQPEASGTHYPSTTLSPPSPTISVASYQSGHGSSKPHPSSTKPGMERDDMQTSPEDTEEDANADPPYSLLIYQALRNAPDMKLPLQGIYSWFVKNTAKGKDRNSKGWQNSIRHNLSMNAGFEAVREESVPGKKSVNYWRLTDEAVKNGIQSTTRYRKQANYKKTLGSDPPAPQRQRSGAKGGKATKITAKFRGHVSQDELRRERCRQRLACQRRPPKGLYGQYYHHHQSPTTTVSPFHVPGPPLTRPSVEPFDLGSVVGCADAPPCTPIFCDMAGPAPDCPAMDNGFMGWCVLQPFPHGLLTGPEISSDLHLGV